MEGKVERAFQGTILKKLTANKQQLLNLVLPNFSVFASVFKEHSTVCALRNGR